MAVVPGRFTWDDVGHLGRAGAGASAGCRGNVAVGPVHLLDSDDCVVWSAGDPIVLSGVKDLVIVHANGRILVMPRQQAPGSQGPPRPASADVRNLP